MTSRLLFLFAYVFLATAQQRSPMETTLGLKGPVHTVVTHTEQLHPDPRALALEATTNQTLDRRLPKSMYGLMPVTVFDENGMMIHTATLDEKGKTATSMDVKRNADGSQTESIFRAAGQPPRVTKSESVVLSASNSSGNGSFESSSTSTIHSRNNGDTTRVESVHQRSANSTSNDLRILDKDGRLQGEQNATRQGKETIRTQRGPDGEVQKKTVERRDDKNMLSEHSEFDGSGKLIRAFHLIDGIVTNAWQDPAEQSMGMIGRSVREGDTYQWRIYPGGEWETSIFHHPHSPLPVSDSAERFNSNGKLLEKLLFRYERDAQGNWTSRTVIVVDPETNTETEIQRDTRTITYYPN